MFLYSHTSKLLQMWAKLLARNMQVISTQVYLLLRGGVGGGLYTDKQDLETKQFWNSS